MSSGIPVKSGNPNPTQFLSTLFQFSATTTDGTTLTVHNAVNVTEANFSAGTLLCVLATPIPVEKVLLGATSGIAVTASATIEGKLCATSVALNNASYTPDEGATYVWGGSILDLAAR